MAGELREPPDHHRQPPRLRQLSEWGWAAFVDALKF
jgi:hypothetical protein